MTWQLNPLDIEQYATRPPHIEKADPGPTWYAMQEHRFQQVRREGQAMLWAGAFDATTTDDDVAASA